MIFNNTNNIKIEVIAGEYFTRVDPALEWPVLESEHPSRAYCRADSAAHAAGPHDILAPLGVGPHINAHFTIGGTVTTGNTLTTICGYSKPGFETLNYS